MVNKDLLDYIKKLRTIGKTDAQIKSALLSVGWQLHDIEEAFRTLDAEYPKGTTSQYIQSPNINLKLIRLLIGIIVAVVGILIFTDKIFYNRNKNIQSNGVGIQIEYGEIKIYAQLLPQSSYTFVINNGSDFEFSDGWFAVWTAEQADALKVEYGDFTRCKSSGSRIGINSLINIIVFAADDSVRAKIKNLIKISKDEPLVELQACQLDIKNITKNNRKIIWSGDEIFYLVKDINILKKF